MKIIHIITGISRNSGGPARSSQGLVAALNHAGVEAWLLSCVVGEEAWLPGVTNFKAPTVAGNKALHQFFIDAIHEVKPDLIHLHGIWQWQIHLAAKAARACSIPYVVAPRGMLEPWSLEQRKWKKRLALWLYQGNDLRRAAALHATAESEAEQFRKLGFKQEIILSPNAVNVPDALPPSQRQADGKRRALFMSRIHPKKGLVELMEAWSKVNHAQWVLEIVGTDSDGYQKTVEEAARHFGVADSVIFTGPLMDEVKWQAYCRADLFVLPTYSENFGIVIAEALYAHVPVITTKGTPWQELEGYKEEQGSRSKVQGHIASATSNAKESNVDSRTTGASAASCVDQERDLSQDPNAETSSCQAEALADNPAVAQPHCGVQRQSSTVSDRPSGSELGLSSNGRCGWWIDIGIEPLIIALREAMALSDEQRHQLGLNGRQLVEAKYTWPAVAQMMVNGYKSVLSK